MNEPDRHILKVPCPSCHGFGSGEDQNGHSTGTCGRCDATGFIEVKRKIVERKEEAHE